MNPNKQPCGSTYYNNATSVSLLTEASVHTDQLALDPKIQAQGRAFKTNSLGQSLVRSIEPAYQGNRGRADAYFRDLMPLRSR